MVDDQIQQQLNAISTWTDDQIKQAAISAGEDPNSRVLGIYFAVDGGRTLPNLLTFGGEYVRFVTK